MSRLRSRVPAFTLGFMQTWLDADFESGKFSPRGVYEGRSTQCWRFPIVVINDEPLIDTNQRRCSRIASEALRIPMNQGLRSILKFF
ncbi:hypothetical protein [Ralstonia pseudosolanacearum]|uniref:Uncharacterized protein n=1 Tax=Ralstonia solanacearum TaxID=305 RepID=A0AA92K3U5_RALSL|nr:hypothetical protein [Ralstonia pseudosolanacearum]QOK97972.1 hypothetical protein HF909_17050 [Ralstonia pseudosolanacearum]UWD90777.1 hypothetical protein NY025_24665 [Ralstonia pseudosolanacearum]